MQDAESNSGTPSLLHALADLAGTMELEGNGHVSVISIEMPQSALDRALSLMERARQEDLAGNRDGAWFFFSEAKALAFYHNGVAAGRFTSPATHNLRKFLKENGGKGGTQKGVNSRELNDRIVEHMLKLSAEKTWATLADFEKEIRTVAREVISEVMPNSSIPLSDSRLQAILKEKEIAKINRWVKRPRRRRRPTE